MLIQELLDAIKDRDAISEIEVIHKIAEFLEGVAIDEMTRRRIAAALLHYRKDLHKSLEKLLTAWIKTMAQNPLS